AGYSTVQAAIDAASPGDTVTVCPGIWVESLTLGDDKTLAAADPTPGVTVIDPAGADHAVVVPDEATPFGLSILGATATAIVHTGTLLTLSCLTVDGNSHVVVPPGYNYPIGDGGGLVTLGALVISESMFSNNEAGYGGGAIMAGPDSVDITDTTFL